jgi:hypothetical protein
MVSKVGYIFLYYHITYKGNEIENSKVFLDRLTYLCIIMRLTLPPELQEKVDRAAQTTDVSKQMKLLEIIDSYFSQSPSNHQVIAKDEDPLGDITSLVASLDVQLKEEKLHYQQLYEQYQYLQGEYALVTTKLLPAAQKTMTPWWTRLIDRLKS